jgi:cell division protein FtsB
MMMMMMRLTTTTTVMLMIFAFSFAFVIGDVSAVQVEATDVADVAVDAAVDAAVDPEIAEIAEINGTQYPHFIGKYVMLKTNRIESNHITPHHITSIGL